MSRVGIATAVLGAMAVSTLAISGTSSAGSPPAPSAATCAARPWTQSAYQSASTPAALALMVFQCLEKEFPSSFRHDEVGIVSLNAYPWFQNINEFGLTSTTQQHLAKLGMPPITLEDGPGGVITKTSPSPTALTNELALGATFDTAEATSYGDILGSQAHAMGYDGVQAPDLNLVRVPSWGRATESFGESPVLSGEMGAAEAVAIESQHVIAVLKHFGPYSQDTDRKELNQQVSERAYQETYIRPFTFALHALLPQLAAGGHAVGIMCSYGNVNTTKACRSPELADELRYAGVNALVRSDLDVKVNPSALLLNGVDLIKPMNSGELAAALDQSSVDTALNAAVRQVFRTEFADGLVNGKVTAAHGHRLTGAASWAGRQQGIAIEQRAAVLLKNTGILPLSSASSRVAVVADTTLPNTCSSLAAALSHALPTSSTCTVDNTTKERATTLFSHLWVSQSKNATRTTTFVAPAKGTYVVTASTLGDMKLTMGSATLANVHGLAEFSVAHTAQVGLERGARYRFTTTWRGAPPVVVIADAEPQITAAVRAASGAKVAVVLAYDLAREGMDRSTLQLPGAQNAVIAAVAARVPTIVLLETDGAVTMPWLSAVQGVMEVWSPGGSVDPDRRVAQYAGAWTNLLDGSADPSGRLPETFPVSAAKSPMGDLSFWPGIGTNVDLNLPPDNGIGIGMPWYRQQGWPVLFPFGFGLSYADYQLEGGTLSDGTGGLQLTVTIRDANALPGWEVVQVYGDFPSSLGEPKQQLVGFGTVDFTTADLASSQVRHLTITLSPDALTVYQGTSMHIVKGSYCFEASTYDGDPHSWTTGAVALGATPNGQGVTGGAATLAAGSCAS